MNNHLLKLNFFYYLPFKNKEKKFLFKITHDLYLIKLEIFFSFNVLFNILLFLVIFLKANLQLPLNSGEIIQEGLLG